MKKMTKAQRIENRDGWLFMAPAMVIFLTLVVFAIIASFLLAFTEWNFLSGLKGIQFVGLDNFIKLFTRDRKFKMALGNTILYAVTVAPISILLALVFAYMINDKVYFKKFNRLCFFVPYISSMVALAAVFRFLFRSDGPINLILTTLGVQEVPKWLTNSTLCKIPIICVMVYAGIGFNLIVYMAALQNVPRELYEAAEVDGASKGKQFFKITLPMLSPHHLLPVHRPSDRRLQSLLCHQHHGLQRQRSQLGDGNLRQRLYVLQIRLCQCRGLGAGSGDPGGHGHSVLGPEKVGPLLRKEDKPNET